MVKLDIEKILEKISGLENIKIPFLRGPARFLEVLPMIEADIVEIKNPKAKKEHECFECGSIIHKGGTYRLEKCLRDHEWTRYKVCRPCVGVRPDMFIYGRLEEHISEKEDPKSPEDLKFLVRCMKSCAKNKKYKEMANSGISSDSKTIEEMSFRIRRLNLELENAATIIERLVDERCKNSGRSIREDKRGEVEGSNRDSKREGIESDLRGLALHSVY